MNTRGKAFAETLSMRISEKAQARRWFRDNPDAAVSCADFERIIKLKTCHCTRILNDLKTEGTVIVAFTDKSKHSNRTVQYYKFSGVMYEAQPKPQHEKTKTAATTQLKLFP